jgi:phosphoglycolate phosphatase-like HAD superfamily hydrolase
VPIGTTAMSWDAIICDWNGTIIEDRDEKPLLESIAVDVFKASIPRYPFRMAHILRARRELQALYTGKRRDAEFDFVIEMFRIYNERIVRGLPVGLIHRAVEAYAHRWETQQKLDRRVLRPIDKCHQMGKLTGVLSAGYAYGIQSVLEAAGYDKCFDFYEANSLTEKNGRVTGFELGIYRNKQRQLLEILSRNKMDARRVAYLGDSDGDAGCFEIAGYPIVAFLTPVELKERYAAEYKAFVPEDEADLAGYLAAL